MKASMEMERLVQKPQVVSSRKPQVLGNTIAPLCKAIQNHSTLNTTAQGSRSTATARRRALRIKEIRLQLSLVVLPPWATGLVQQRPQALNVLPPGALDVLPLGAAALAQARHVLLLGAVALILSTEQAQHALLPRGRTPVLMK